MSRRHWLLAGVAFLVLATGFGLARRPRPPEPAVPGAEEKLLSAPLRDLQGRTGNLAQYRGKVLVVNFWATWCPPCREEIPLFVETQAKYADSGLQFVGIALDDPEKVAAFVRECGVNFPIFLGGLDESETLRQLGNPSGGLPYTLIYDRNGRLREKLLGSLDRIRLEQVLAAAMAPRP